MPNSKEARNSERRQMRNRAVRSRAKTFITRAEKLVFTGEMESAQAAVAESISALDRAAEKGIIHPNNAARRKSRLMKKLNQAQASAVEVVGEEVAEAEEAVEKAEEKPEKKPKVAKKPKAVKKEKGK
ncbi:MAG: 30S ribosomal protein S20 [Dehalococcoidales bacterium]